MPEPEPMDVEGAIDALNAALPLQYRSAITYTVAAGSLVGFQFQPLTNELGEFARLEIDDARHLVEKISALGGDPVTDVAGVTFHADPGDMVQAIIDQETELVDKLKEVIPHTGQEGRSEALEHRMEHMIMRKQEQVDALLRAMGERERSST